MSETKRYIVEFYGVSEPEVIESIGGIVRHNFSSISEKLSANLSDEMVNQLLYDSRVKSIDEVKRGNGSAQSTDWSYEYTLVASRYRGYYTGSGVKVAIVDTGVATHPDLNNVMAFQDYIGTQNTQYDDQGHGTFISGLIAAKDNSDGYVGIAPGVSVYACKVLDSLNRGYADDFVAGIEWAVNQGVDIINFSITMDDPNETTVRDACRAAYNAGVIVVACSGNGTMNDNIAVGTVSTPAKDYSCVAVGSINNNGSRSSFSNYGSGLDLVAPGSNLNSTGLNNNYWGGSGTSFATAVVVGHLAILKQKYPSYSRSQLVSKLLALCNGSGNVTEYGAGCIMAEASSSAVTYLSTATTNGCRWSIHDLSGLWDDNNYLQACISTYANHPPNSTTEPSGILDRQYPPTNGSNNYTPSQDFSSGLSAATLHTLYGYVKALNGRWYPAGNAQIKTALSLPRSFTIVATTPTSITVRPSAVAQGYYYKVKIYDSSHTYIGDREVIGGGNDIVFDHDTFGLIVPNSLYYFTVSVRSNNDEYPASPESGYYYAYTANPTPGIPTVNSHIIGNGQISVIWDRPASCTYLTGYTFYHKLSSSNTWIEDSTVMNSDPTVTAVYGGLTNGLSYDFACKAYAYQLNTYYRSDYSQTLTLTPSLKPSFDWTYAGCQPDGTLVVGTLKSSSYRLYVSATEWNTLISKVEQMYTYKGYQSYTPTMDAAVLGADMLHTQFNQVKNAIGWFYNNSDPSVGVGIADKQADVDDILADDFNILMSKLNNIT